MRPRRLPDFLVIGTQKAATTSLYFFLRQHPQAFLPAVKEPNFFIEEGTWRKGLDWYAGLFERATPDQRVGEASPGYTMFPIFAGAPARIAATVPEAKLVYLLREPIERMRSSYLQSVADGHERRPMREALLLGTQYVSLSCYALQIEQYLEHFERSQLLVVKSEDLVGDGGATLAQVLTFVGLDPALMSASALDRHNVSATKRAPRRRALATAAVLRRAGRRHLASRVTSSSSPLLSRPLDEAATVLDDDLRARLLGWLRPDLVRLRALLGDDFDAWGLV